MTPSATAGYSGTPLAKKLGIKEGSRMLLVGGASMQTGKTNSIELLQFVAN